jgi:uncharacterized protein YceH (UPF0502 family)
MGTMGDFEQTLREIFGESVDRFSKFQTEQRKRVTDKLHEIARESVGDEIARLEKEIADLRARVASLEARN